MNNKLILTTLLFSNLLFAQDTQFFCSDTSEYIVEDKAQKSIYRNCVRDGMTYWYKDNGSVKSKVNFTKGKENGLYTSYYDNGAVKITVNYTDGEKDGIQKNYYDNKVLGSVVMYDNGRREGVMTDYDIDGYKSAEVFYKRNYKVGLKKFYNQKGEATSTQEFKMDRNPVVVRMLKDKRKEVLIDLSKYGLMPKDAPKEERMR